MHTISGTVTLKAAGQPPLSRVQISLVRLEKEPGQPAQPAPLGGEGGDKYRTASGLNGEWGISGVPDGLYQLRIEAGHSLLPGRTAGDVEEWSPGDSGALSTTQEVTVKGGDVSDLRLELVKGGALETVVTMSKGVTMPEYVSLRLVRVDAEAQKRQASEDDEEERVEESTCQAFPEEPACAFNGLEAGSYLLRAATDEIGETPLYIKSVTLKGQDLTRTPFKISIGQTIKGVRVVLSNQVASVSGKAWLERQGKKPAARQWVVLAPVEAVLRRTEGEPRRERTADDGSFSFETVEPGEYFLFLPAPKVKLDEAFWRANAAKLPRLLLKPGAEIKDYEVFAP
jgi:hypothetical protein